MNKFRFYFILFFTTIILFSCSKDDNKEVPITPPKPYAEQYTLDIVAIEDYLKTHSITVTNNPGGTIDQDVAITKIPVGGTEPSIWSYKDSATFPKLLSRDVSLHDITYKLYYLVIREGVKDVTGIGGESPSNVDAVFVAYKGNLLDGTVFDSSNNGQNQWNLDGYQPHDGGFPVITGWSEAFPKFKTGQIVSNVDGTLSYTNFGSGMIFIPSGLGYYNEAKTKVPAYSPLVFSVKLYSVKRFDHDGDGIPSYQEDVDPAHDGYMYSLAKGVVNPDDTDGDEVPDYKDVDDDNDNYTTKLEITKPTGTNSGLSLYFPYNPIVDNPFTTVDETETKGVPEYSATGNPDYTSPSRKRIYLDKDHHTAK